MINKILNFFHGYLVIEISGNALERFINQIIEKGITLWDIRRIRKDRYLAKIDYENFNKLRPLVKRRMCRVKILRKKGFPFIIYRAIKRYYLLAGIVIFILIIYLGSSFLWFIEIDGLEKIPPERVMEILSDSGVKPGILKRNVSLDIIEKQLLKEEPGLSWVNLKWQGTQLEVYIVEKEVVEKTRAGNIVAAKEGIIEEMIVLQGQPVVKEGDTVSAGQPLILGVTDEEGNRVRARGIVKATVWYEGFGEAAVINNEVRKTGNSITIWKIKLGKYTIPLFPDLKKYENFTIEQDRKKMLKWRNLDLPIELIKERYNEVEYFYEERSLDMAAFLAREDALQDIFSSISNDAVIDEIKIDDLEIINNTIIRVRMIIKAKEDIAKYHGPDEEGFSGNS